MKVHFYAMYRQIVGAKEVDLPVPPGGTVRALVGGILERYPDLRPQFLDADGNLAQHVHLFVNGRDLPFVPGGLDAPLRAEDEIKIFPPVGGGS